MKGLLFHSEVFFTLFFWYEIEFLLSCWLRQCWSSDMLTYFIVHSSSEKVDWSWIKQRWLILNQTKWYEVEFLLSCWLRQCWSSDMLTYFIVHFSSEKVDWSWIKQSEASQTRFFDEQMCTQAKYMSLTVSIKFINGKIWVSTPL